MISDSCVQNAEQKILFNLMFQITVHKVHYKNKSNNSLNLLRQLLNVF